MKDPTLAPGKGILLDIEAELSYWKALVPTTELAYLSLPFESLIPTIKFGYDCYLLGHAQTLVELLPTLGERYRTQVRIEDQLDWRWADQIIRHAWGRMRKG